MRFVTAMDRDKLCELIDKSELTNSHVFDLKGDCKNKLEELLDSLNGSFDSIVIGIYVPDNYGPLSSIWTRVAKILPIKSGDAIMQFNVNSDECLFYDFNDFTTFVYMNSIGMDSRVSYAPVDLCIAVSDSIHASNFDCAYVVNSNWGKDDFNNVNGGELLTSILDLNVSRVWR